MQHGVAVAPVVVTTFHPVHELETFALVVVTCSKLDGECVLIVAQLYLAALVEGRCQDDLTIINMSSQNFFLTNKQLGQHNTR